MQGNGLWQRPHCWSLSPTPCKALNSHLSVVLSDLVTCKHWRTLREETEALGDHCPRGDVRLFSPWSSSPAHEYYQTQGEPLGSKPLAQSNSCNIKPSQLERRCAKLTATQSSRTLEQGLQDTGIGCRIQLRPVSLPTCSVPPSNAHRIYTMEMGRCHRPGLLPTVSGSTAYWHQAGHLAHAG